MNSDRRYVQDFGRVKLAVVERPIAQGYFKIATEVVTDGATTEVWNRLERLLDSAGNWTEAQ